MHRPILICELQSQQKWEWPNLDLTIDPRLLFAFSICATAALATLFGSLFVNFTREPSPRLLAFGLAFAGGAMVYVSMIEIIGKSQSSFGEIYNPKTAHLYTTLAFFAGIAALMLLDRLIPNPHNVILSVTDDIGRINGSDCLRPSPSQHIIFLKALQPFWPLSTIP